ncbi:PBP1A family penicillin-binding protein [Desulfococcaceae bacterium HSG9]|nr:PBP1A family penicillin-binding protein [Desulfococcaceae bacterium HSG9]
MRFIYNDNKRRRHRSLFLIVFLLLAGAVCGVIVGVIIALTQDLPQIRQLESFQPSTTTRIYSSDGVILSELFAERRDPVKLKAIPPYLKAALLATEDQRFYSHSGLDIKGIGRAIISDIRAGKFIQGGSTITQQLAKTLFLTPRRTLLRKLKEAFLAFQLERRYTKDAILTLYLNQIYLGSGTYGVDAAAQRYFGKSVNALNLSECALLAGLPQAPSRYSPLANKTLAVKRRNVVLRRMLKNGIIAPSLYDETVNRPLELSTGTRQSSLAPYFIAHIKQSLEKEIGTELLYKGGLTVSTTLVYQEQKAAALAVSEGLEAFESRNMEMGIRNSEFGIPNSTFPISKSPQAALIALDVKTGGIRAMIGGRDFKQSAFNRATMAERQPGSAFKPLVYALAIERGFSQNTLLQDAPAAYKIAGKRKLWQPQNFSGTYKGSITFRKALSISQNIPAVRLIEMLGISSVVQFAHSMGIRSQLRPYLSLALGASEVRLIDLTAAYAVFANQGQWTRPFGVTDVYDRNNRQIWRVKPERKAIMSRAGAAVITDMLAAVINEGTGRKARVIGRPLGGKTGTTNRYKDALFVGFSPSIATGVWVGMDDFTTLGNRATGAKAALPIWIQFMQAALDGNPYQHFDLPDDVVRMRMDRTTGKQIEDAAAGAVDALFIKGATPAS